MCDTLFPHHAKNNNKTNKQTRWDTWKYTFIFIFTHWGRMTHICVGNLIIIGSDNALSPGRRQAIIWTNAGLLLIGTLEQTSVKYQSKF